VKEYHKDGDLVKVKAGKAGIGEWTWGIVISSKEVFRDSKQRDYKVILVEDGYVGLFHNSEVRTVNGVMFTYEF
jgi:hypothetical protein